MTAVSNRAATASIASINGELIFEEFLKTSGQRGLAKIVITYVADPIVLDDAAIPKILLDIFRNNEHISRFTIIPSEIPAHMRLDLIGDLTVRVLQVARDANAYPLVDNAFTAGMCTLALNHVMDIAAPFADAKNLISFFRCIKEQEAVAFFNQADIASLPPIEKANRLRTWLQNNPEIVARVKELFLYDVRINPVVERYPLFLTALPTEIGLFTNLEHLSISSKSSIIHVLPDSMRNLKKLKCCSLTDLKLQELPEWFGDFQNMETLYLQFNRLQRLPDSICRLRELNYLDAGNNHLRSLPDAIGDLEKLQLFDVRVNYFVTMPLSMKKLLDRNCDIIQ